MTLRISGKSISVGDALRGRVSERTDEVLRKYFDGNYSGHITLSKDGFGFRTDCSLHLDSGITLEADSNAADAYASADQALLMIEKRLRRYKSRLKDRSARKSHAEAVAMAELTAPTFTVPSYVIEAPAGVRRRRARRDRLQPGHHCRGHHVAEAVFGQRGGDGTRPDRRRLPGIPARLQRAGEHYLPPAGRQCRLDRPPGAAIRGIAKKLAGTGIDAPGEPPYREPPDSQPPCKGSRLQVDLGTSPPGVGTGPALE
jgi:ribosomal subunit interface protein